MEHLVKTMQVVFDVLKEKAKIAFLKVKPDYIPCIVSLTEVESNRKRTFIGMRIRKGKGYDFRVWPLRREERLPNANYLVKIITFDGEIIYDEVKKN